MSFLCLHHKYFYLRFCVDSICKEQQYNVTATYMVKLCGDQCVKPTQKSYIIYRGRSILKGTTNCQVTFSEMYSRIKSKLNFILN